MPKLFKQVIGNLLKIWREKYGFWKQCSVELHLCCSSSARNDTGWNFSQYSTSKAYCLL